MAVAITMSNFLLGLGLFLALMGFGIYLLWRGQKALHDQLDGRLSELVKVTKELAHSQGVKAGRAEAKKEARERKK